MATGDEHDDYGVATVRYGWCMAGDHDTAKKRGGCPIQVSNLPACPCECHKGAREARGYLEIEKPRMAGDDLPVEPAASESIPAPEPEPEAVPVPVAKRRRKTAAAEEALF